MNTYLDYSIKGGGEKADLGGIWGVFRDILNPLLTVKNSTGLSDASYASWLVARIEPAVSLVPGRQAQLENIWDHFPLTLLADLMMYSGRSYLTS